MLKSELRSIYKTKRKNLDLNTRSQLDARILNNFKSLDFSGINCIHIYLPIEVLAEPNTYPIIDFLRTRDYTTIIVISKSDFLNGQMKSYIYSEQTQICENEYGIPEPVHGEIIDNKNIDLVVLPLLVVDHRGNRVGYDKGFYDRFLQSCRKDVKTIGLSYFEPVDAVEDADENDVPIRLCVTPQKVYQFV